MPTILSKIFSLFQKNLNNPHIIISTLDNSGVLNNGTIRVNILEATKVANNNGQLEVGSATVTGVLENYSDVTISEKADIYVIKNEQGCKILSNSEFAMILKQKPLDLPAICKIFDISEEESKYVIDIPAGQGIIVYGEDKVAFRNQIAKEFYIYQINQTSNMQISRS